MGLGGAFQAAVQTATGPTRNRAVAFFQQTTAGLDSESMAYFCGRGIIIWNIIPPFLGQAANEYALKHLDVTALSDDTLVELAKVARPDCIALFSTPKGERWLRDLFRALRPL